MMSPMTYAPVSPAVSLNCRPDYAINGAVTTEAPSGASFFVPPLDQWIASWSFRRRLPVSAGKLTRGSLAVAVYTGV
jgi:hypothetical protein